MHSEDSIEYEMAFLVRLLTATQPKNPEVAALERSAYLILHQLMRLTQGLSVRELAESLKVDLSTMSRQIAAMEAKGLIERSPSPVDSRVSMVKPSSLAREQFCAMQTARRSTYEDILRDWTDAERRALSHTLSRLNQDIAAYKEPAKPNDDAENGTAPR